MYDWYLYYFTLSRLRKIAPEGAIPIPEPPTHAIGLRTRAAIVLGLKDGEEDSFPKTYPHVQNGVDMLLGTEEKAPRVRKASPSTQTVTFGAPLPFPPAGDA